MILTVSFGVFVVMEMLPGQAARKILGPFATREQADLLTEKMGLNRPAIVR
jgi:peptide/nickel transport system permease protein